MATHAGSEGSVYVSTNLVAEVRSFSYEEQNEMLEDTEMSDAAKTFKAGKSSWNGSLECWWDETNTNGQGAMTIGASVTLNLYPEGGSSGDTYKTGTALIQSISISSPTDGIVEAAFTFQGTGALTETTVT